MDFQLYKIFSITRLIHCLIVDSQDAQKVHHIWIFVEEFISLYESTKYSPKNSIIFVRFILINSIFS